MAGYSQNDPQWSGDLLGSSNYWYMGNNNPYGNARAAGCYVTAGADVLKAFGHDITPGDLNRLATERGLINGNGDVVRADWLSVLFPDVCQFVEYKDWGNDPAELAYFDVRNDLNTEIIVEIDDSPSAGMQTHFMRVVGWDGGTDVIVDDSWDAIRKGINAYGARWNPAVHAQSIIYTATKYVKTPPAAPAPLPTQTPEPDTPPQPDPTPVETPAPLTQSQEAVDPTDPTTITITTPEGSVLTTAPAPTTETNTPTPPLSPSPSVQESPSLLEWVRAIVAKIVQFLKSYKKG